MGYIQTHCPPSQISYLDTQCSEIQEYAILDSNWSQLQDDPVH